MARDILKEFERIFFPQSIAVVGASPTSETAATGWLAGLQKSGYKGKLYPVHPTATEVLGLKAYPRVSAIPGPVDFVLCGIPRDGVPELIRDCGRKGAKGLYMFTAGFAELGTEDGRRRQEEIARLSRETGVRLVGPNCIGISVPKHHLPYGGGGTLGEAGPVAVLSHSGQVGGRTYNGLVERGIGLSKVVSYGNACDLDSPDYLEYLEVDPDTKYIGMYFEGVRDGRRLFDLMKRINRTKPIVIWKAGRTAVGARSAASHTGSLAGSDAIWSAMARQIGVTKVEGPDELVDALSAFHHLSPFTGHRVGVAAGIFGGGGGVSVMSSDAITSEGLEMPAFSAATQKDLASFVPLAGSIMKNPLDLSPVGRNFPVLERSFMAAAGDVNVDILFMNIEMDGLIGGTGRTLDSLLEAVCKTKRAMGKPVVLVSPLTLVGAERRPTVKRLAEAGIPVFSTFERAARAVFQVRQYWLFRQELDKRPGRASAR